MRATNPVENVIDADVIINDLASLVEREDYFLTCKEQQDIYSSLESIELSIKLLRRSMEDAPSREEQIEADTEDWMRVQYAHQD